VDQTVISRTVGAKFANSFAALLAAQTRGGIKLAVNEDFFDLSDVVLTAHAIMASITMRADGINWQIIVVYGPQGDAAKLSFYRNSKIYRFQITIEDSSLGILISSIKLRTKITPTVTDV
jgi:hypothetical protein